MVSGKMSVRTSACKRADCKTQAPDISCGRLDSSLLGAQRTPYKNVYDRSLYRCPKLGGSKLITVLNIQCLIYMSVWLYKMNGSTIILALWRLMNIFILRDRPINWTYRLIAHSTSDFVDWLLYLETAFRSRERHHLYKFIY